MRASDRNRSLLRQIVRLRRAGRAHPRDRDIVAVRAELEKQLGPTVSMSLAGEFLGVSHTTVRRWVVAGDIPTVMEPDGHSGVPVQALLSLYEDVERERAGGSRRRHVIELVMSAARDRAAELDVPALIGPAGSDTADRHDRVRLRSLTYHRAVARQLRRPTADDALHKVWQWRQEGRIDERYADAWESLLSGPLAELREKLGEDSLAAADLRQNSPFAGVLSEAERRKILQEVR